MPINLTRFTTIRQVAAAATEAFLKRPSERLCLHLAPGYKLSFHAPAGLPAREGPDESADVSEAVIDVIANEVRTGSMQHHSPSVHTAFAQAIMESVLGKGAWQKRITSTAQLDTIVKHAEWVCRDINGDAGLTAQEARTARAIRVHASRIIDAPGQAHLGRTLLTQLKPAQEPLLLLKVQYDAAIARGDRDCADVRAYRAFHHLFLRAMQKLDFPEMTDAQAHQEIGRSPTLQYAYLEYQVSRLESAKGGIDDWTAFADAVAMCPLEAFEPLFLQRSSVGQLYMGVAACRDLTPDIAARLKLLDRNSERYEAYRQSPLAAVPGLEFGLQREFQVQMYERLVDGAPARPASPRAALVANASLEHPAYQARRDQTSEFLGKDQSTVQAPGGEASLIDLYAHSRGSQAHGWELERLLRALAEPELAEQPARWLEAVHYLAVMRKEQAHTIFAPQQVVDFLHSAGREHGVPREKEHVQDVLAALQVNAARLEAFMASALSRNPNFADVGLAALIAWWEVMRDVLPPDAGGNKPAPPKGIEAPSAQTQAAQAGNLFALDQAWTSPFN